MYKVINLPFAHHILIKIGAFIISEYSEFLV